MIETADTRYFESRFYDFLFLYGYLDNYLKEMARTGEDAQWYLLTFGKCENALKLSFDWQTSIEGELYWSIAHEQFQFYLKGDDYLDYRPMRRRMPMREKTI